MLCSRANQRRRVCLTEGIELSDYLLVLDLSRDGLGGSCSRSMTCAPPCDGHSRHLVCRFVGCVRVIFEYVSMGGHEVPNALFYTTSHRAAVGVWRSQPDGSR